MATIYFIRHGQTDMNVHHMLQGRTNTHLNETGRTMAAGAGEFLKKANIKPDRILVSPLDRVKETVEIASGIDRSKFIEEPLLIEFCFGPYEGVEARKMAPEFHHDFFETPEKCVMPEGAETYEEILGRARQFLEKLAKDYPDDDPRTILCGTHGGILHALLVVAQGKELHNFWNVEVKNCAVFKLTHNPGTTDYTKPAEYWTMENIFQGYGDSFSKKEK